MIKNQPFSPQSFHTAPYITSQHPINSSFKPFENIRTSIGMEADKKNYILLKSNAHQNKILKIEKNP